MPLPTQDSPDAPPAAVLPPWRRARPQTLVLAVYLALTLLPLLQARPAGVAGLALVAAHAGLLLLVVGLELRGPGRLPPPLDAALEWLPLLALPGLYAELPVLMAGVQAAGGGDLLFHDPAVQRLEQALFGGQPSREWAAAVSASLGGPGSVASRVVSEVLHLCYALYYPLIYIPPLLLFFGLSGPENRSARHVAFRQTVLALTLALSACFAVMVAFPVQGPRYLWTPDGMPDGPVRGLVLAVLEAGSSRGAAFPSSHVAIAVAQAVMALHWQRRVGVVATLVTLGLSVGTVFGGFHYGVDALVGLVVGLGAAAAARQAGSGAGFTSTRAAI